MKEGLYISAIVLTVVFKCLNRSVINDENACMPSSNMCHATHFTWNILQRKDLERVGNRKVQSAVKLNRPKCCFILLNRLARQQ